MGFEARWTTGGWRVVDVPALDPPRLRRPAGRPGRGRAAGGRRLPVPRDRAAARPRPLPAPDHLQPSAQAGRGRFQRIVLASFPATHGSDISRACSIGGRSEHKEGRAWDWAVTVTVSNPSHRAAARQVFSWLLRADPSGRRFAMARRLGVMHIIHDRRI
jgi:hypothetical protein